MTKTLVYDVTIGVKYAMSKSGYKQSPEHIAKRIKSGEAHHNWKGSNITEGAGRLRAWRLYPGKPCETCGAEKGERHHINGDTTDNCEANIRFLCRKCHMAIDGRLEMWRDNANKYRPLALKAIQHKRNKVSQ